MKLFMKSIRDGVTQYSSHEGMTEDTVLDLLTNLGCTDIQSVSQEEFNSIQGE